MSAGRVSIPVPVWRLCVWLCLASAVGLASADQTSPRLPALFEALKTAESDIATRSLEADIWREWHVAPDKAAAELLDEIIVLMEAGELRAAPAVCDDLVSRYPGFR